MVDVAPEKDPFESGASDAFTSVSKDTDVCITRHRYLTVIKPLGTTGTRSQTHLIQARFGTKVSVF